MPNSLGNDNTSESAFVKAGGFDALKLRLWLKSDLAQLLTPVERTVSKHPNTLGNNNLFYDTSSEPPITYDLDAFRNAKNLFFFLIDSE